MDLVMGVRVAAVTGPPHHPVVYDRVRRTSTVRLEVPV
jgi:hypothetical protein